MALLRGAGQSKSVLRALSRPWAVLPLRCCRCTRHVPCPVVHLPLFSYNRPCNAGLSMRVQPGTCPQGSGAVLPLPTRRRPANLRPKTHWPQPLFMPAEACYEHHNTYLQPCCMGKRQRQVQDFGPWCRSCGASQRRLRPAGSRWTSRQCSPAQRTWAPHRAAGPGASACSAPCLSTRQTRCCCSRQEGGPEGRVRLSWQGQAAQEMRNTALPLLAGRHTPQAQRRPQADRPTHQPPSRPQKTNTSQSCASWQARQHSATEGWP